MLTRLNDDFQTHFKYYSSIIESTLRCMILLLLVWIDSIHSFNFPLSLPLCSISTDNSLCKFIPSTSTFRPNVCVCHTSRDFCIFYLLHPFCIHNSLFQMLKVFGLLVLLSLSYSFECNEEGYEEYLEKYNFKVDAEGNYTQLDI